MNALWSYFWPALGLGMISGIIGGSIAYRRRKGRTLVLALSAALAIGLAALWHGPLGGADRFAAQVELGIHKTLVYYEMTEVTGHLHRGPLTRRVLLTGQADDFQRSELVRLMDQVPGVASTVWSSDGSGGLPLIVEGGLAAVLGFLLGLLLAYLVELRRRYNAQWKW
jgi:hypothetical protein